MYVCHLPGLLCPIDPVVRPCSTCDDSMVDIKRKNNKGKVVHKETNTCGQMDSMILPSRIRAAVVEKVLRIREVFTMGGSEAILATKPLRDTPFSLEEAGAVLTFVCHY